jgi:hypothetical protein
MSISSFKNKKGHIELTTNALIKIILALFFLIMGLALSYKIFNSIL